MDTKTAAQAAHEEQTRWRVPAFCPNGHRRSREVTAGDWKGHRECCTCGTRFNRDGTR